MGDRAVTDGRACVGADAGGGGITTAERVNVDARASLMGRSPHPPPAPGRWHTVGRASIIAVGLVVLLSCAFLPLCTFLRLGTTARAAAPKAIDGVLDLTGDTVDVYETNVGLDGDWEFYWGQFLSPESFAEPDFQTKPFYVTVPGGWKNSVVDGQPLPGEGFGTYRLRVDVPPGGALALYVPYVRTAHALFVNGRLAATRGVVGVDRHTAIPAAGTEIVSVNEGATVIELVMHVSNFSFREGGLGRSIILGAEQNIRGHSQRSLVIEVFLTASLFVIGGYHVGMWLIRPQDRHLFYFALFCLAIALRTSVMDQAPLTLFAPHIPWEFLIKIEYIGYYTAVPLMLLFLHYLYPKEFNKKLVTAFVVAGTLFSAFVALTPATIHSHALIIYQLITVVALVFIVSGLTFAVRRRRAGAKVILAAGYIVSVIVIYDILFFWGYIGTRALVPMSVLGMVAAHSLVLSKKFSDEFEHQRQLMQENANLLRMVEKQIVQIKDSRRLMNEREEHTRREVAELLHGSVQSRLLSARYHLRTSLELLKELQLQSTLPAETTVPPAKGMTPPGNDTAAPDPSRDALQAVLHRLQQAGLQIDAVNEEEIRQLSYLLHPMLLRIGLVPAIRALGERFADQLIVEVRAGGALADGAPGTEVAIPEAVRLAMYRIVEEALTNALKHAQAQRVDIFLAVEKGSVLTATVRDDGVGIDRPAGSEAEKGFGMQMIAARVEELGGTWSVDGRPGTGTSVHVRLPFGMDGAEDDVAVSRE